MAHQIKVATCNYCGSRTVLQNTARDGHELACGSCGAPLHEMKAIRVAHEEPHKPRPKKNKARYDPYSAPYGKKQKKPKKRKSLWRKALEEAWDVVEDVFD